MDFAADTHATRAFNMIQRTYTTAKKLPSNASEVELFHLGIEPKNVLEHQTLTKILLKAMRYPDVALITAPLMK